MSFKNITASIQLDYKEQNEKLKDCYSMLGVVKKN